MTDSISTLSDRILYFNKCTQIEKIRQALKDDLKLMLGTHGKILYTDVVTGYRIDIRQTYMIIHDKLSNTSVTEVIDNFDLVLDNVLRQSIVTLKSYYFDSLNKWEGCNEVEMSSCREITICRINMKELVQTYSNFIHIR